MTVILHLIVVVAGRPAPAFAADSPRLCACFRSIRYLGNGEVWLTFSHHIPGCEQEDLGFFKLAQNDFSFKCNQVKTVAVPQLWSPEKTTIMFIYILRRINYSSREYDPEICSKGSDDGKEKSI